MPRGLAVLLTVLTGFAPVAAQDAPSLRAAMLGERVEMSVREENAQLGDASTRPFVQTSARSLAPLPDTTLHDPWLGRDKALHAGGSFLLTLSAQYVLTAKLDASEGEALPFAAGATLSFGLAKEILDSQRTVRPHFSTRDLIADAVGVALAMGLILL